MHELGSEVMEAIPCKDMTKRRFGIKEDVQPAIWNLCYMSISDPSPRIDKRGNSLFFHFVFPLSSFLLPTFPWTSLCFSTLSPVFSPPSHGHFPVLFALHVLGFPFLFVCLTYVQLLSCDLLFLYSSVSSLFFGPLLVSCSSLIPSLCLPIPCRLPSPPPTPKMEIGGRVIGQNRFGFEILT